MSARLHRRTEESGFTLLEVLVALALLSIALLVIMRAQDNAVLVSEYEEQQIQAATLAKRKMVDVQLDLEKNGFGDDEKENCGHFAEDFDDRTFDGWDWCWTLKKVDLPLPMDALGGKKDENGNEVPQQQLPGGIDAKTAGDQLSKAVRVLKMQIKWKLGEQPQELDVTTHLVNFSQLGMP